MNITKTDIDKQNATLTLEIEPSDYEENVNNVLKDYRKKANIKGFRPGKVPAGLIKKMYGKQILADEVMKMVSSEMQKYLINEKINILGEPIPNEDQEPVDFDNQSSFTFKFDLGLTPDFELNFTQKDKIPFYKIKVEKDMIEEQKSSYAKRFGSFKNIDEIKDFSEMIKGDLKEIREEGDPIIKDNAVIALSAMKDEDIKNTFKNKKVGDEITFNLRKAYPNDSEISSLLGIEKEQAENLDSDFTIKINEISVLEDAEINQEFFDKVYGEGEVKTEEEFENKIKEELEKSFENDSNYQFANDLKKAIIKKADIELPEEFLKRWLVYINNELTKEKIEEDFENYKDELKWQVIKSNIARNNDISVKEEELREFAKQNAMMQFMQYGMNNIPDEHLDSFADSMLKNEDDKRRLNDQIMENKIIDFIKGQVSLNEKSITKDKFVKMLEEQNS